MIKETFYLFRLDKQYRILLPAEMREVYGIESQVYLKLQVMDSERYLQISGRPIDFFQAQVKLDEKFRLTIPKSVREKFGISTGDEFDSFESEVDTSDRSLLLKVRKF